jgi:hypothetical protein
VYRRRAPLHWGSGGAVGRFGAPCSGTRLRPVHGEKLVEALGVQSMGSANSRPGVRSVGWRSTSLWMLGRVAGLRGTHVALM